MGVELFLLFFFPWNSPMAPNRFYATFPRAPLLLPLGKVYGVNIKLHRLLICCQRAREAPDDLIQFSARLSCNLSAWSTAERAAKPKKAPPAETPDCARANRNLNFHEIIGSTCHKRGRLMISRASRRALSKRARLALLINQLALVLGMEPSDCSQLIPSYTKTIIKTETMAHLKLEIACTRCR